MFASMTQMMLKRSARRQSASRRRAIYGGDDGTAGDALARNFLAAVPLPDGACVSGYWPTGDEIDPRPLLERLHTAGHPCALPVVVGRNRPLAFRRWAPGDLLVPGVMDIPQPAAAAPEVIPDLLLVPLLAFDAMGYRLGYGGGYYDRTIAALRPRGSVAVGLAWNGQEVPAVPRESHDRRLDWVVTETAARRFPNEELEE